jgi:hypothetical protein
MRDTILALSNHLELQMSSLVLSYNNHDDDDYYYDYDDGGGGGGDDDDDDYDDDITLNSVQNVRLYTLLKLLSFTITNNTKGQSNTK